MKKYTVIFCKLCLVTILLGFILETCGQSANHGPIYHTYQGGDAPLGIAIDSAGHVWVTNANTNSVTELSPLGATIKAYNVGTGPVGIAIDSAGNVWVSNYADGTVSEINLSACPPYTPYSCTLATYTYSVGSYPMGITINASGNIWISASNGLTKLNSNGIIISTYSVGAAAMTAIDALGNIWASTSNGITELSPTGTTIDTYQVAAGSIAIDASGNIWAVTNSNNKVSLSHLNLNKGVINTIGVYSVGTAPHGIAIDAVGNVWVTNKGDDTVTELSPAGKTIGTYTVGIEPEGIAIDSAGNVWVANEGDMTVTEFPGITKGPQFFPLYVQNMVLFSTKR